MNDCLVMAKPLGARCNLACAYCYYLDKTALPGPARMADDLLESYVRQRLEASPGPVTAFEWHGGEPTLLGLAYFRRIVELQRRHRPQGRIIRNGLQTNGLLLDESWARFLRAEGFTVGLSLDGPAASHDAFRSGQAETEQAFRLLHRHGVHVDVLCVLHTANVPEPLEVYRYFRALGITHLQFLPLTGRPGAAPPEALGAFLCTVFDEWVRHDLGKVVVQLFDEALRPALGLEHALCVFRETCGEVVALERDGGVYACDHFVDAEHRLGSLADTPLAELTASPALAAFGRAKLDALAARCRTCEVLAWCHGGCPKDRLDGLNVLCPAYLRFFKHARPALARLLPRIAHIQVADNPGRHQPGTGELNYPFLFAELDRLGYQGYVGLEYVPAPDTLASFGWLKDMGFAL